ncbi:MAG: hypothetical protein ACAI35_24735 [Candidatus Methylacidiphilales bacterium]
MLLLILVAAVGWLGAHAPVWTLWLTSTTTVGRGEATSGVGNRTGALAARLEGLGARDAARQLREAEQLYHKMDRQSRAAMGLPPAAGPNAVSNYLKEEAIQRLSRSFAESQGSTEGGRREFALFNAMEQKAALIHAGTPGSSSMKLQPGVISEL